MADVALNTYAESSLNLEIGEAGAEAWETACAQYKVRAREPVHGHIGSYRRSGNVEGYREYVGALPLSLRDLTIIGQWMFEVNELNTGAGGPASDVIVLDGDLQPIVLDGDGEPLTLG